MNQELKILYNLKTWGEGVWAEVNQGVGVVGKGRGGVRERAELNQELKIL